MTEDTNEKQNSIDKAFSALAEEFSDSAAGTGASLGRTARFMAGAVEVVVTSPLLIPKGYKKLAEKMKPKIDARVAVIPEQELVQPNLAIAGPALEAMRFSIEEEEIADMFAELLAASMDARKESKVHHSFVEVIKQLTPGEAKILQFLGTHGPWPLVHLKAVETGTTNFRYVINNFTNIGERCGVPEVNLVPVYLDNLCRLGLTVIPADMYLIDDGAYEQIEQDERMQKHIDYIKSSGREAEFERKLIRLTEFGKGFCRICLPTTELEGPSG